VKTIILYGCKRSGNHGLINLFIKSDKNYVHINDTILSYDQYNKAKLIDISKRDIDRRYTGLKGANLVILSMENQLPDYAEMKKFENMSDIFRLILLRNPYNTFASIWKFFDKSTYSLNGAIYWWFQYSKIFLNESEDDASLIKVIYDKFYSDSEYRIDIFNQCGIDFGEVEGYIDGFTKYGVSSFEDKKLQRSRNYTLESNPYNDDREFMKMVSHQVIFDNWKKIREKYDIF